MIINLIKDRNGFITGFISHIKNPSAFSRDNLRQIPDSDYRTLFYYLVGRDNVKEKGGVGSVDIGGLKLKDEGDHKKAHEKLQRDVFKHKPNHLLH